MDWAWTESAKIPGTRSVLGRIGYMGYANPDLASKR